MSQTSGRFSFSSDAADNYYADCIRVLRWSSVPTSRPTRSHSHCQLQLSQVTGEIRLVIKNPSRFLGEAQALVKW